MNIKEFFKNKEKLWKISIVFLFILLIPLSFWTYKIIRHYYDTGEINYFSPVIGNDENDKSQSMENLTPRMIDGKLVESGKEIFYPVGVMIENHIDSRPPANLDKALLVYEAEVEAGITRFLAFFSPKDDIDRIGPVRSARPYYLDWAAEFDALYTHCGGSPEALARIIADSIFDFNEFYYGGYFWRDENRDAPHNIYTSTELLNEYLEKVEPEIIDFDEWQFKDDADFDERPDSSEIVVHYKNDLYEVRWVYDKENNSYIRYDYEDEYLTEDKEEIRPKNIVIQYVESEILDEVGRRELGTIGTGRALICNDGVCQKGTWAKNSLRERTKYYLDSGEEASFYRGLTWVNVVPNWYEIDY